MIATPTNAAIRTARHPGLHHWFRCPPRACGLLLALLAGGGCPAAEPTTGWKMILQAELAAESEPRALGFDESGAPHLLVARPGPENQARGRILRWTADGAGDPRVLADDLELGTGRSALLGWRGRCFLAATPVLRMVDAPAKDGAAATVRPLEHAIGVTASGAGTGFGGLTMGPDGRLYGSFSGGTIGGIEESIDGEGVIFRFEPDGRGFEIVQRGLRQPSAPVFDELGRARLVDHGVDRQDGPRLLRLLDGGFGGPGDLLPPPADVLPEAAVRGDFGVRGFQVLLVAAGKNDGAPGIAWRNAAGAASAERPSDPPPLAKGARVIDLASDWNGRPHLLLELASPSAAASRVEVWSLGVAGDPPDLAERLDQVARHLDDPGREPGTDLLDLLHDPDRRVRWQAQWAISRRNDAPSLLLHGSGQGEMPARLGALWGLGVIARRGGGAAVPGDDMDFAPLPKDKHARWAATMLGGMLGNEAPMVRMHALRALASGRRASGLIPFSKMLGDPDPLVREETLLAAARLRWRGLSTSLSSARPAADTPPPDPRRIADVLGRIHPPEHLQVYARHGNQGLRLAAVEALRRAAHPTIAAFVFDRDREVAAAAVRAIDQGKLVAAYPAVARRLAAGPVDDWPQDVRQAAERCAAGGESE